MADGWLFWICTLLCLVPSAFAANAAYKKHAEAKVTCGRIPEKYYNVSMRNLIPRFRVISTCDQSKPELAHNASNLVDGLDWTWWQSTAALNRANITIDMEGPNRKVSDSLAFSMKAVKDQWRLLPNWFPLRSFCSSYFEAVNVCWGSFFCKERF